MKLTVFLLLISVFQVFATENYAQNTKLNMDLGETTVAQVLDEIEQQSEFYFLFNQKLVDVDRKVNLNVKEKKINDILAQVFNGTGTDYVVIDRQIVLSPGEYLAKMKAQQPIEVSGMVTDAETGEPLPGVNIVVEGTTTGTTTNMDGEYSIEAPGDATLVFSFVG
ncbi:MAG: carboxypeptidase-like regulatory domain-containing protein, partial [Bacteroidota bacterium]